MSVADTTLTYTFSPRVGEMHTTNEGYKVRIIKYEGVLNCDILFNDGLILKKKTYQNIKSGQIMNPYHLSICGVGYIGIGNHKIKEGWKITKKYSVWHSIIQRCYDEQVQLNNPSYKSCIVSSIWHNFQVFAEWYESNYKVGFELDKDILFKEYKVYSPETCCFVPKEINTVFTKCDKSRGDYPVGVYKKGNKFAAKISRNKIQTYLGTFNTTEEAFQVYKKAKEEYILELADKYCYDLNEEVYEALVNYRVNINN